VIKLKQDKGMEKEMIFKKSGTTEPTRKEIKTIDCLQLPFILGFLEYRKGAVSSTTTGTYDDIDGFDRF